MAAQGVHRHAGAARPCAEPVNSSILGPAPRRLPVSTPLPRPFATLSLAVLCGLVPAAQQPPAPSGPRTTVSIAGDEFHINGRPTYEGRTWNGRRIQGLLMNARLVQG